MAKKKSKGGPEKFQAFHNKGRNTVFIAFYDGNLSGTVEITPEQAVAVGDVGKMALAYRKDMEEVQNADRP